MQSCRRKVKEMIKASITLAIVTTVISFLMSALSMFPLTSAANENNAASTEEGIDQVGERFSLCYKDIINDLASFQEDPSLERAEGRQAEFTNYARNLMGQYEDFTNGLRDKLDTMTIQP